MAYYSDGGSSWNFDLEDASLPYDDACPLQHKTSGSGIRLSWPRGGDHRRAIVGKSPTIAKTGSGSSSSKRTPRRQSGDTRIVHVSQRDLEMHYHFTNAVFTGCNPPVLDIPLAWNSVKLEVEHQHLFQYFQSTASKSLAVLGHDAVGLGDVLIRIALASCTTSATAVLQALLALSALNLYDVCMQSVELKLSAIKALQAPLGDDFGTTEAIQHVAAGMLLLSFETHQASCTSGEWLWYLRGVKKVIQAVGLDQLRHDSDLTVLLDWVYYHDVLARFSLQHWHRTPADEPSPASSIASSPSSDASTPSSISSSILDVRARTPSAPPPALNAIELLSEVCDAVSAQRGARLSPEHLRDQKDFLKILDWRIRSMQLPSSGSDDDVDTPLIMELYQLAMLVYLNQATENLLNQAARTQQQISKAFGIISRLRYCDRQLPVFIFGVEARSDEQRASILDLITRTENGVPSRSFNFVRRILQAIWVQDDLTDRDIHYCDKLTNIISCCRIMPTFV